MFVPGVLLTRYPVVLYFGVACEYILIDLLRCVAFRQTKDRNILTATWSSMSYCCFTRSRSAPHSAPQPFNLKAARKPWRISSSSSGIVASERSVETYLATWFRISSVRSVDAHGTESRCFARYTLLRYRTYTRQSFQSIVIILIRISLSLSRSFVVLVDLFDSILLYLLAVF